jgi:hypothetical protein
VSLLGVPRRAGNRPTSEMPKLYKIRDWETLFENNRSRKIDALTWVPIPNRHDGENFSMIMQHPGGAMIFSAWILMLQVASKCVPRGTLLKTNRQPHTPESLSAKCRCPAVWFETAFEFLERQTDWLEVEDIANQRQATDVKVPDERQADVTSTSGGRQADVSQVRLACARGMEGNGIEVKEGNRREGMEEVGGVRAGIPIEFPAGFPNTEAEAITAAGLLGVPEDFTIQVWNECAGRNGLDCFGREINRWSFYLKSRWERERGKTAKLKADGTAGVSASAQMIRDQEDLKRSEAEIKKIEDSCDSHVSLSPEERARRRELKNHCELLKKKLGFKA